LDILLTVPAACLCYLRLVSGVVL